MDGIVTIGAVLLAIFLVDRLFERRHQKLLRKIRESRRS